MKLRRFPARAMNGEPGDVAADWLMREEDGRLGPEGVAARDAWLAEHPAHVAAYDAARRAMRRLDAAAADPHILALRQAALARKVNRRAERWRIAAAFAAMIVLAGGGAVTLGGEEASGRALVALDRIAHPGASVYRTAVGERSTISLPDGSVATLNTDTVLRVAYSDTARGVRLVRGQALFEVAHGKPQPFEVYAGDRIITALGTVFDVRLQGAAVKVALVEGHVRVRGRAANPAAAPSAQIVMTPGEVLDAHPSAPMRVHNVDVERETSWRSGVIVFDETPLAEAVAELNRYSDARLVVDDPSIAAFHVSGVFKTGDLTRFARTVEEILPVDMEARGGRTILLSRRPESISPAG